MEDVNNRLWEPKQKQGLGLTTWVQILASSLNCYVTLDKLLNLSAVPQFPWDVISNTYLIELVKELNKYIQST